MTTGRELQEVEREDGGSFHAGYVTERADKFRAVFVGVVDNEGSAALAVTPVAELAFAGTQFAAAVDFVDVRAGADRVEELEGRGGFGDGGGGEGAAGDDKGNFGDGRDLVAAG